MMQILRHNAWLSGMIGVAVGILLTSIGYAIFFLMFNQELDPATGDRYKTTSFGTNARSSDGISIRSTHDLENLLNSKSSFDRALVARYYLANANKRRVRELFQIAEDLSSRNTRNEIQSIVIERLASIDPRAAIGLLENLEDARKRSFLEIVFREWASSNLKASAAYAESMDGMDRASAFTGILASESDLSDQVALDIARRLEVEQAFLDHSAATKLLQSIEDPEATLTLLFSMHGTTVETFSDTEKRYLVHVVHSLIERAGVDAIRIAVQHLTSDSARVSLLAGLFFGSDNEELALAIYDRMYAVDRDIALKAIAKWAESEPHIAFRVASAFEDAQARSNLQREAIFAWTQSNPESLLDSLNDLPENLREWSQRVSMFTLARNSPQRAIEKLDAMKDSESKQSVASQIASSWGEKEPRAALDWALSDPVGRGLEDLVWSVISGISRIDLELALKVAQEQPADERGVGYESAVMRNLASRDAESAMEMLHYARNEETLRSFYWQIGPALIREGKTERAMEMVREEPHELQTEYYRWIVYTWYNMDAQDMYDNLDKLPSTEVRTVFSNVLLWENDRNPFLSDEQIERLQSLLSESESNAGSDL